MNEIAGVDKNLKYYKASIDEVQKYAKMTLDFDSQE